MARGGDSDRGGAAAAGHRAGGGGPAGPAGAGPRRTNPAGADEHQAAVRRPGQPAAGVHHLRGPGQPAVLPGRHAHRHQGPVGHAARGARPRRGHARQPAPVPDLPQELGRADRRLPCTVPPAAAAAADGGGGPAGGARPTPLCAARGHFPVGHGARPLGHRVRRRVAVVAAATWTPCGGRVARSVRRCWHAVAQAARCALGTGGRARGLPTRAAHHEARDAGRLLPHEFRH